VLLAAAYSADLRTRICNEGVGAALSGHETTNTRHSPGSDHKARGSRAASRQRASAAAARGIDLLLLQFASQSNEVIELRCLRID
jgi:hypothetical protein